ncbi:MAG: hypothetical protein IPQ07_16205 [Myxococcales bacterium]|nr:hypothetical protein [Myxococcales bacterium]
MAGQHVVEMRRVLRGLGRGKGFEWSTEPAPVAALTVLHQALTNALAQVSAQLSAVASIPAPACTVCGTVMTPDLARNEWHCPGCGTTFPAVMVR